MKRRTDTQAQQYRIRAEYAARRAVEALDTVKDEWLRLRAGTIPDRVRWEAVGEPIEWPQPAPKH